MSARKARRRPAELPPRPRRQRRLSPGTAFDGNDRGPRLGPPVTEAWPDGDWVVRHVPGPAAAKVYRCPGCDQEIAAGTAHVVAWPADGPGPEARRHWHRACWQRRPRRPRFPGSGWQG